MATIGARAKCVQRAAALADRTWVFMMRIVNCGVCESHISHGQTRCRLVVATCQLYTVYCIIFSFTTVLKDDITAYSSAGITCCTLTIRCVYSVAVPGGNFNGLHYVHCCCSAGSAPPYPLHDAGHIYTLLLVSCMTVDSNNNTTVP